MTGELVIFQTHFAARQKCRAETRAAARTEAAKRQVAKNLIEIEAYLKDVRAVVASLPMNAKIRADRVNYYLDRLAADIEIAPDCASARRRPDQYGGDELVLLRGGLEKILDDIDAQFRPAAVAASEASSALGGFGEVPNILSRRL